ncbi:hypothetical protein [Paracidovorax citrulli]
MPNVGSIVSPPAFDAVGERCHSTSSEIGRSAPDGLPDAVPGLFGGGRSQRLSPEEANQHLAGLTQLVTELVFAYLADPFDRATLAMTCRLMKCRLDSYKGEFSLFRNLITAKKGIIFSSQSDRLRAARDWFGMFTNGGWTSWRAASILRKTIASLTELYPNIPQRIFHELWPLFMELIPSAKLQFLEESVHIAARRSPLFAATLLAEFAARTVYSEDDSPRFHDRLFDLTVPYWHKEETRSMAAKALTAIAQRLSDRTFSEDQQRWHRVLALVPSGIDADSQLVAGLALSARRLQRTWEKNGRRQGTGYAAEDALRQRVGRLPSLQAQKRAFIGAMMEGEAEIERRREARYQARPRDERDRARSRAAIGRTLQRRVSRAPMLEKAAGAF